MTVAARLGVGLGLALALAACGPVAPVTPLAHRAAPPPPPPPTLTFGEGPGRRFTGHGLPAVRADGAEVVLVVRDDDGGRGNPNVALEIRDRGDRVRARTAVLTAEQGGELPETGLDDATAARLAAANRDLAARHAAGPLVPLVPLVATTGASPQAAFGDGLELTWREAGELEVVAAARRLHVDGRAWLAPAAPGCAHPAFLFAAYADLRRRVVLVELAYRGTDTCWEPEHQRHVIAW